MRRVCELEFSSYNILLSVVFFCIFTLSLIGNSLVILTVLSKTHRTRSITNFYLLNLAIADLLRSVVCMPLTLLSELTRCWILGPLMCKLVAFLQPVGVCASAYTLAVIAVERYYAICRPLQSRKWKTKKRALLTISMVWIFSFACNFGTLFIFDSVRYRTQWTCDTYGGPLVLLFIPLCVMVSLYGHVIYSLSTAIVGDNPVEQRQSFQKTDVTLVTPSTFPEWLFNGVVQTPNINKVDVENKQQSLSIPCSDKLCVRKSSRSSSIISLFRLSRSDIDPTTLLRSTNQEKILMAKKKVTRMLMTIVVAFAVCWLPNFLWWLLVRASDFAGAPVWHSGLNMALTALTYISSTTNPITYCFMNKGFRSSVLSYCAKRKRRRNDMVPICSRRSPTNVAAVDTANSVPLIKVIVKTIFIHGMSADEEKSIMGEVKLLQKMHHPMIIGYYDYFVFENQLAIVMQYAEGGTMEKLVQDQKGVNFSEAQVLNYFTQILIALNHIHSKSIVHRDLKTQNILLNRKKTLVKLSDFGISKELTTRSLASTVIGTPNYLSPEICEGRAYNQKSDLWSLGCVLYELLELKRAFDGENLPAIVMKITKCAYPQIGSHASSQVKGLVDTLLQLNERKRPDTKELLTCPLILPITLTLHLDIGRLSFPQNDKRKPNVSGRLRTTPTSLTSRTGHQFVKIQEDPRRTM
ncbi:hypothetical protein Angca_006850, partial [Angiostrongylus cantonensis]